MKDELAPADAWFYCGVLSCPIGPLSLVCLYPLLCRLRPTPRVGTPLTPDRNLAQSLLVSHSLRQSRSVVRQQSCHCPSLSRTRLSDFSSLCMSVRVLFVDGVVAAAYRRGRVSPSIPIPSHMSLQITNIPFQTTRAGLTITWLLLRSCV